MTDTSLSDLSDIAQHNWKLSWAVWYLCAVAKVLVTIPGCEPLASQLGEVTALLLLATEPGVPSAKRTEPQGASARRTQPGVPSAKRALHSVWSTPGGRKESVFTPRVGQGGQEPGA